MDFPRDVEAIAEDFVQRRSGLLKALTEGAPWGTIALALALLSSSSLEGAIDFERASPEACRR